MALRRISLFLLAVVLTSHGDTEMEKREITEYNPLRETLNFLKPEAVTHLAAIKYEKLPKSVQGLFPTHSPLSRIGDNSHWCCAVPLSKTVVHSASVLRYHQTSHRERYRRKCGLFGWGRCTSHRIVYRKGTHYTTSYRSVEVPVTCPSQKVVCCKSFIMVARHCLPISELEKLKDDLLRLQELGAI